ncbi:hypothetical protein [Niabella aquatica]
MMNDKRRSGPPKFAIALCAVAAIFGFGAIVMLLWNAILPEVLHVSAVTYWQALGILILSKILFGGFAGGRRKYGGPSSNFREKFRNMTDEEKEKFKEAWKNRCGR